MLDDVFNTFWMCVVVIFSWNEEEEEMGLDEGEARLGERTNLRLDQEFQTGAGLLE